MFRKLLKVIRRYPKTSLLVSLTILLFYWVSLPRPLFKASFSPVLEDRDGVLLGARIAADGQWRFPMGDSLPEKYIESVILFEDRRFFYHPGIDPVSLVRALWQNIRSQRIVSGGSTISMQVIRMARGNRPRTVGQKILEIIMATRLELGYSKQAILNHYAAQAPFGGNVVGLEAATWRYYGKNPQLLSWAEAATLAVLPNSPGLIHPGRNRTLLLAKRNRLLDKLYQYEKMDSLTWSLAKEEPLPAERYALPNLAPHLLDQVRTTSKFEAIAPQNHRFRSTLAVDLQKKAAAVLKHHQKILSYNEINNLAALVVEVKTGAVLAYVGNVIGAGEEHHEQVDVISAPRSTGSILKPFLYASMLDDGVILPNSIVPDVPVQLNGYRPENFHKKYDGVISARRALIRSLNVPFVNLLQEYGLEKFHFRLQQLDFTSVGKPPSYYGLPLILGGAECTLWETTNAYAGMARTLRYFYERDGMYSAKDFLSGHILQNWESGRKEFPLLKEPPVMSASAIWYTFEAMRSVERPSQEGDWKRFRSSQNIAWKTGTSFGFRDGWAVGVTPDFAVGIWAGNADGEGRPGLIGIKTAGPVLFDLFNMLPSSGWFEPPFDEMIEVPVCQESGYRALKICPVDTTWIPRSGLRSDPCPYHQLIHTDQSGTHQVSIDCEPSESIKTEAWFVLPPLESFYYQSTQPQYRNPPPYRSDCLSGSMGNVASMQLIYPKYPTKIYVPKDLDGEWSRTVFSVAHVDPETLIYWHIDNQFIGKTETFHNMELNPSPGKHILVLVDEKGQRLEQAFEIIHKKTPTSGEANQM